MPTACIPAYQPNNVRSGNFAILNEACMYVYVCILSLPLSIEAFRINVIKQCIINIYKTGLRIPTGGRQTSGLFTRAAEKLNSGLMRTT